MSLCQRALFCSVIVVFCSLVPSTTASPSNKKRGEEDELIDLLKKLRYALEEDIETKSTITSLEDNVNEEHGWGEDLLRRLNSGGGRKARLLLPDTQISPSDQQQLLDAMNAIRRTQGASNMYKLHWNTQLASLAQDWSDKCVFNHGYDSNAGMEDMGNFSSVGQTIYASTDTFSASSVINSWHSLKRNYDARYDTCNMGQPCGAYKQLVSGYTTDVGCGLTTCSSITDSTKATLVNAYYIVCYYGPPGSYWDQPTLIPGPACTQCISGQFYCDNGLCDNQCKVEGPGCTCSASCQNCGQVTSDCRCHCNAGSTGVNCAAPCADQVSQKCGKKGSWSLNHCKVFDFVRQAYCPKFCKFCSAGDPCNQP